MVPSIRDLSSTFELLTDVSSGWLVVSESFSVVSESERLEYALGSSNLFVLLTLPNQGGFSLYLLVVGANWLDIQAVLSRLISPIVVADRASKSSKRKLAFGVDGIIFLVLVCLGCLEVLPTYPLDPI